jgi:hypothetical protein
VLDDPRDGVAAQRPQLFAADHGRQLAREERLLVGPAGDGVVEVGGHLEEGRELGIVVVEQVVELRIAAQHHLGLQWNVGGLQRHRADQAQHLPGRFDADLAAFQGALQGVPAEGLRQYLAQVEDQVAAVGPMQRAGLDQREVGDQGTHFRHVLDAADQVRQRRVVLMDDRRPLKALAAHDEVHLVPLEAVDMAAGGSEQFGGGRPRLLSGDLQLQQAVNVVEQVLTGLLQVLADVGKLAEADVQLVDRMVDGLRRDLAVQLAQGIPVLHCPGGNLLDDLLEFALQFLDLALDTLAFFLRQGVEGLGLHHRAVFHGREGEAERCAHQGDVLRFCLFAQRLECGFLAFARAVLQGLAAIAIVFALESRRDRRAQFVDQLAHCCLQLAAQARRQADRLGLVRRREVVQIDPVRRNGFLRGLRFQDLLDRRVLAGSRRAEDEEVVTFLLDGGAEADRLQGAVLADDLVEILQLVRRLEREIGGIAAGVEFLGWKRRDGHNSILPSMHRSAVLWATSPPPHLVPVLTVNREAPAFRPGLDIGHSGTCFRG